MRQSLFIFCFFLFARIHLPALGVCPDCEVNLPPLPADTMYLTPIPVGTAGNAYNHDISFRLPMTVPEGMDPWPPGLPISAFEIVDIKNIPPGLCWKANQTVFQTATQTDGCIKLCGMPLASGSFDLMVVLKATLGSLVLPVSFTINMNIAGPFSLSDSAGCNSATISFVNNIPPIPGISYEWEFGDGTGFAGENPPPHTYSQPGAYEVKYKANFDATSSRLLNIKVLSVGCTDLFDESDLYVKILLNGQNIFENEHRDNVLLPYNFPVCVLLEQQSDYVLEIWDRDSGIDGSNDYLCGNLPFNVTNGSDTLKADSLQVILTIEYPVKEIFSTRTVTIYPLPFLPPITANTLQPCPDDTVVLTAAGEGLIQWLANGEPVPGATDSLFSPEQSGFYQVQATNEYGCTAVSEGASIEFLSWPIADFEIDKIDSLTVTLVNQSSNGDIYLWDFDDGVTLSTTSDSAVSHAYAETGVYIIRLSVGNECDTSILEKKLGLVSTEMPPWLSGLRLFPNPNNGIFTLEIGAAMKGGVECSLFGPEGRLLDCRAANPGGIMTFDYDHLPPAAYLLRIRADDGVTLMKVLVR